MVKFEELFLKHDLTFHLILQSKNKVFRFKFHEYISMNLYFHESLEN